ncbi:MAG TPA: peptidylprolyl isomerase [Candidatus Limnocylindrales bacterium]|nr:peptidylprolyl isomerase [Candidatus Limnocylindrales bacterium]
MNKFHILVFVIIIFIFGLIVYSTQKESFNKSYSTNQSPSLPPTSDKLEFISQSPLQQQQAQQQGQQGQQGQQQAQGQQAPQAAIQGPINASISATIKTTKGDISIILFGKEAQNTVANFISKAKGNYYKNLTFHRVEDWVTQGGDPTGTGNGGTAIQTELNTKPFLVGSIGMAAASNMQVGQGARVSNDSQFFFTKKDADWLNGQYTNFGMVTEGMDVVEKIKIGDKILGITFE